MNKLRVIDLLNKIANGEEVPKIKYDKHILKYNKDEKRFIGENRLNSLYEIDFSELNDEVEIIEDEPRDIEVCGSLFTKSGYDKLAHSEEEKKIPEKLKLYAPYPECEDTRFEDVEDKINEIIDYLEENK